MKEIDSSLKMTHRNSTTALTADLILMAQSFTQQDSSEAINYKTEAIKGNFMPATLLLDNLQISINEIINGDTGETLLHLAVKYSYYNVIRTLIETFKADINAKNIIDQTPLHLNCKNSCKDLIVLNYLLNCTSIDIEVEDINGLRAIDYAVINNFNIAFLVLVSKGANLLKVDKMGNGLIYYALINDNKFIVSFLYTHHPSNTLNVSFYDQQASLADVLITNKNTCVCKFIAKYHYENIDEERIESCTQFISQFTFYNRFNYEVINTMYFYKKKDLALFLNGLFPMLCCCFGRKRKRKLINNNPTLINNNQSNTQSYRLDTSINKSLYIDNQDKGGNVDICYDNTQYNFMMYFNRYILIQYHKTRLVIILLYFFMLIGFKIAIMINSTQLNWFDISNTIVALIAFIISLLGIFNQCHYKTMFIKEKYTFGDNESNIFSKDFNEIQSEECICEICLNIKLKTTYHCRYCNKCVKEFYFHSMLFNRCVNRTNAYIYNLFLYSMLFFHLSCVNSLWKEYCVKCFNMNNYFFTKIIIAFISINPLIFIAIIYMAFIAVIIFGKLTIMIICIGTGVPYYSMFRYHKKSIGNITLRTKNHVGVPYVNLLGCFDFMKNLIIKKTL